MPTVELDDIVRLNPGVWLETYGSIRGIEGESIRPRLNVLQRRILALYLSHRDSGQIVRGVGLKPRKKGFSTMVSAIHYSQLQKFKHDGVVMGNKLKTSQEVFDMIEHLAETDEFKGKWGSAYEATAETIKWAHGAELQQSTAKDKGSARGMTPQFVHGTEVAHWENAADVLVAMLNAVPKRGFTCVFLESTPAGAAGPFFDKWQQARWPTAEESPDGQVYWKQWESMCPDSEPDQSGLAQFDFVRVFAAWFEFEDSRVETLTDEQKRHIEATLDAESWYSGEKDLIKVYGNVGPRGLRLGTEVDCDVWEQLAWRRMMIKNDCKGSSRIFDQEYPKDPQSCFLASGRQVFDSDALTHLQVMSKTTQPEFGGLTEKDGGAFWTPSDEQMANYWRWEAPMIGCRYLLSVDPAEGEDQTKGEDPDRHSVLVLRDAYMDPRRVMHRPKLVARLRPPNRMPMIPLSRMVRWLSFYYGRCCVIPEMNNSGMALITALRMQTDCPPIWQRIEVDPHSGIERRWDGWRTTDSAEYKGIRSTIIWHLHEILRKKGLDCYCPHVASELMGFVDKSGRMEAGSGHDDDVMALAIGMYNISSGTIYEQAIRQDFIPPEIQALLDEEEKQPGGFAQRW